MRKSAVLPAVAAAVLLWAGPSPAADAPGKPPAPPPKAPAPAVKFNPPDNTVKSKQCKDCHPNMPAGKGKMTAPARKP